MKEVKHHAEVLTRKITFLFAVVFILACSCKKEFTSSSENSFIKFGLYDLQNVYDMLESESGALYIVGAQNGNSYLVKAAKDGSMLWKKQLTFSIKTYFISEIITIYEQKNGNLVLAGTIYDPHPVSAGYDIGFIKMDPDGQVLKTTAYSHVNRDTASVYTVQDCSYSGYSASDGMGGIYINAIYYNGISNSNSVELIHYSSSGKIEQVIPIASSAFYKNIEASGIGIVKTSGGDLVINYYRPDDGLIYIEKLDTAEFFKGHLKAEWRTPFSADYSAFEMIRSGDWLYQYGIVLSADLESVDYIELKKLRMADGKTMLSWQLPVHVFTGIETPLFASRAQVFGDSIYIPLVAGKDFLLLKTSTDSTQSWMRRIGGSVSREIITAMRTYHNDMIIAGSTTNSRNPRQNMFLCRFDQNGIIKNWNDE
jgi:hypothetical protein